ncbi:class III chitinase ChiA2 [Xylaria palmicola]|nr:class III chitinase ChiA2 [Xylaria palmicola]
MFSASLTTSLGFLIGLAAALSRSLAPRQDTGAAVVYWGQNGGGTIENNDLSAYCTPEAGIDIIVLALLYSFDNGNNIPSSTVSQSCFITNAGEGQNCEALASAITTCQSNGVKVILSLGGAVGSYSLASEDEATTIGNNLWKAYGNSGATNVQQPFGEAFVNGFDFDLELNKGNEYYPAMISALRSNFESDSRNSYYITGAPQCPIPAPNMGVFYNNNNYTVPCALTINGNAPFNYDDWLFIGVPAAPLAANGGPAGETYYATPEQLADIVSEYKSHDRFSGVMMWSAGFSDLNKVDGCTYAQQVKSILTTGSPC